ncbi:MAG: GAF domain-containing protein [Fulvivirga sp.]
MTNCNINSGNFPFESVLNLSPLLKYWEDNVNTNMIFHGYAPDHISKMIADAPELHGPIQDLEVLDKHQELLSILMSVIFPPALSGSELSAAILPFNFNTFYATSGYQKILPPDHVHEDLHINIPGNNLEAGKVLLACLYILNKFYGTDLKMQQPMLVTIPDKSTGLTEVFKMHINTQFSDAVSIGEPEHIDKDTIHMLLADLYNKELWLKYIKPEKFRFEGFTILKLTDVTTEQMLSYVKYDLLKSDAITNSDSFQAIQQKIRNIFRLPKLELGISYFDPNDNIISNQGNCSWNSFMMPSDQETLCCDYFTDSIYSQVHEKKRPVIVENLEDLERKSKIEKTLIKKGFKSVIVAPLVYDNVVRGTIELATPEPGKLNPVSASTLANILPMFAAAVRRVLSDMHTEVRSMIQEEYTAIHPAVEWRFLDEGYQLLHERRKGAKAGLREIVFQDVYPLYGLADIRNSSVARTKAIQQDLRSNLKQVKKVISTILEYKKMPILDELNYRVEQEIKKISHGLNSGDESGVLAFLRNEVTPTFNHFKDTEPMLRPIIREYENRIDPRLGMIYDKRKDFEVSLTRINETITTYLNQQETYTQELFPHYFEAYKTDGVEYNIYLGDSLVKDRTFNDIYLRNFRLWQLMCQCEIAVSIEKLKPELSNPLDITQLILVQGDPLSIKFRKDEKRFDVDGAYNIRYEIVKKRIDKAYIKDTNERLTQPGKIAIVYTQHREAGEYMKYIDYLKSIDYLTGEVEFLELEELQGANGLQALRVDVNLKSATKEFGNELLRDVIAAIH